MSKTALFVACLALVLVTGQGLPLKKMMLKKKMMMGALLHQAPTPVPVPPTPMPTSPVIPPPIIPSPISSPMIPQSPVPTTTIYETTVDPKLTGETTVYTKATGEKMDDGATYEDTVYDEDMMMPEDNTYTYIDHTMSASMASASGASTVYTTSSPMESTVYAEDP